MSLKTRVLRATFTMESGDVVLDQGLQLRVRVNKKALAIQNRATIEVVGLTTQFRETLLSKFTAWNLRALNMAAIAESLVQVKIEAGYVVDGTEQSSVIFKGQVALCEPTSGPPNIGVRITCFSRQVDKSNFISSNAPSSTTFYQYVQWAGKQMGFSDENIICDTSYNGVTVGNPARSMLAHQSLLIDIQDMYKPNVAAFIDDDQLIVKDRNKIINTNAITDVKSFVGIPSWTEWGVDFTTMFLIAVRVASGVNLTSTMNPSLNGQYVVMEIDYSLTSRDRDFYMKISANPPSNATTAT